MRAFAYIADRTIDASLFVPYARALRANDPQLRALLVALLPRVNNVQGHVELCRLLGSPDVEHRAVALKVLEQVGGKAAFDMLVELVVDPSFNGRIDAIDLMMPRATHQSGPLLAAVIGAGRQHERAHALKQLGEKHFAQHASSAVEIAAKVIGDSDDRIAGFALAILAKHSSEDTFLEHAEPILESGAPNREKAVIEALRHFASARTLKILLAKLRDGSNLVRVACVETAEAIGTDATVPILVEGLCNGELLVRTAALNAIGRLSDSGKVDPARAILWLLRSRDVNVRRIAIEVLNRVGDAKGDLAPRLLKYLRDEDWWVRERTMDALVEMAGAGLTRHLVPYLGDASPVVRRFASNALKRIRDPATLPALLHAAQNDEDWWVREEAVAAIAHIGGPAVAVQLLALADQQPDTRLACIEAVLSIKAKQVVDSLCPYTTDENPDVRAAAMRAIAELGGRPYAHFIEPLANDLVPRVKKTARELLQHWEVQAETTAQSFVALDGLLTAVVEGDADDLLLFAGRAPYVKRRGQIEPLHGWKALSSDALYQLVHPILSVPQRKNFLEGRDVDFSHDMPALGARFRVNLFRQASGTAAVLRIVKNDALLIVLENLGLPDSVGGLADLKDGLVLVGGPTGAGKSTTLAAIVDRINRSSARHVVTIEDPIETVHIGERSLITQRELGSHTSSFPSALRAAMRQDPDVIVVGEMRDPETFQFAVSAAETGHLVLGTMHTSSADGCVARIVNSFSPAQQPQVRAMLAASLRACVCQVLLRRKTGGGRVIASEVMLNNEAIANLIRKGKEFQIPTVIATSRNAGMHLMDHELARLVREGVVEPEEAFARAVDKGAFDGLVAGREPSSRSLPPSSPSLVPPARSGAPPSINPRQGRG